MGIGPAARELYDLLRIKPPLSICDLGSQDVSYVLGDGRIVNRGSARAWFNKLGYDDYTCIDLDGRHGALKLDLNTCTSRDVAGAADRWESMSFDLVANHGTSEHVFNQANVFKLMHDLTFPGQGIMIHAVPTPKFGAPHGFYFYDEQLFEDLARANGYYIMRIHRRSEPREIILVALQKCLDQPFQMPQQAMYDPALQKSVGT